MIRKLALVLLFCSVTLISAKESYEGYKIYEIEIKNEFQKHVLLGYSVYKDYQCLGLPNVFMVKPENQLEFENELMKFGLDFKINNDYFEKIVKEIRLHNNDGHLDPGSVSFDKYLSFSEIVTYLDALAKRYSNRVLVKTVGKSYEGRYMKTITITNGDGRSNKKLIFIDAGIHAREWIAPAGALYVINQLVENFSANAHLLKDYDWIVLPVLNPDGYEYSLNHDPCWRRTRKPVNGSSCIGTDANRNFDFHWGGEGSSDVPCTEIFKGESAFSEPETQIVRDILHSISGRAKMYLTVHSCAKAILYPWGYAEELPENWKDLEEVAQAGANAIKNATGTSYRAGNSAESLNPAAGASDDYALAKANIPISMTYELPAAETCFFPTKAQIKPFVSESWIGIKAMAEKVIEKY